MILTLDEAKEHLRYDGNENDNEIIDLIAAAESAIKKHCDNDTNWTDPAIKHAAKLLIGYWDENRASESDHNPDWYLPQAVRALLTPYRTPTAV